MLAYVGNISSTYRELVGEIPADFLREKIVDARVSHDLRQLSRVAKSVWQPELEYRQ